MCISVIGMRLIPESQANDVMKSIEILFNDKTLNPFKYDDRTTRMLSGEEEGAFAWIATNYLRGIFKDPGIQIIQLRNKKSLNQ